MTNTINESLYLSNYQNQQKATGSAILGKDDFLKLLVTQLQNQDPTNPMEDREFIAQMAQFSSLEQMLNMNNLLERLVQTQQHGSLIFYNQLIGKEITWKKQLNLNDSEPIIETGTGKVISVQLTDDEQIELLLEDGTKVSPTEITKIIGGATEENILVQRSMLIGKQVTYVNEAKEEKTSIVTSVSTQNGKVIYHLQDGSKIEDERTIIKIAQ